MCCEERPARFLAFLLVQGKRLYAADRKNKMTRLSFDHMPVQSTALYCLEQAIFDNATSALITANTTALKNFYVNDGLFSFLSETNLVSFFDQVVPLLASRGSPVDEIFHNL